MTRSFTVRLAYSRKTVTFTPRGNGDATHQLGYIRLNGIHVSGWIYDGQTERVFFPNRNGKNTGVALALTKIGEWERERARKAA